MRSSVEPKSARKARPPRQHGAEASRAALVAAAAELFNTVGYHGTDSNRIARAAGYSPGTFYTHFPDKLAIFLEVYKTWVDAESAAIEAVLKSDASPRTLRARLAATILEHHRTWRVFRQSLRALYVTDAGVRTTRLAERKRQIATVTRQFEARGRGVPSRAQILATLLITEVLSDALADGDVKALEVREADMIDVLAEALRAPGS